MGVIIIELFHTYIISQIATGVINIAFVKPAEPFDFYCSSCHYSNHSGDFFY